MRVRLAEDKADAVMVFKALLAMHAEGAVKARIDAVKMLSNILRLVKGPGSAVLIAMAGDNLAGLLALYEEAYWFGHDRYLGDKGFYILPEHRGGAAFDLLLNEAKAIADHTRMPVFITVNNAERKRGARTQWERRGLTLGYHPQGAVLAHTPGEH